MPNWIHPLVGTAQERAAKLRDPNLRVAMKQDVENRPHARTNWDMMKVAQATQERNLKYEGMSIAEIARQQGKHPLDTLLDLALDEDLQMAFTHAVAYRGDEKLAQRIANPLAHISLSDGGAHVRYLTISMWPVHFLTHWIRDRKLMTLEQAHYKMSAYPAWLADYKDRGTLRKGAWADIMVYDMDKLGYVYDRPIYANDFPGGERRTIQKPTGIRYILVNGGVTFQENQCTGATPGKLLRSYEMVD
jgi:N-acyl-D-aspartate/D-glutamate deacylase